MMKFSKNTTGYNYRHPWYYVRGGQMITPKQIRAEVTASDYCGYMAEDIERIADRSEPQRSEKLRQIKADVIRELNSDLSQYRSVALKLHRLRSDETSVEICNDIHTNMSLKYAHIYNCFAHLKYLDSLLSQQGDLFDF